MISISLQKDRAIAGSTPGYQGINTTGGYDGYFKRVLETRSASGAVSFKFTFAEKAGAECTFSVNMVKKNGEENAVGYDQIHALMAVMGIKDIAPEKTRMKMMNWDATPPSEQVMDVLHFPAFGGKPVGLVLQAEEFKITTGKNEGDISRRMNLVISYRPADRKTAEELYEGKDAESVKTVLEGLKDKLLSPSSARSSQGSSASSSELPPGESEPAGGDFDDDVPF